MEKIKIWWKNLEYPKKFGAIGFFIALLPFLNGVFSLKGGAGLMKRKLVLGLFFGLIFGLFLVNISLLLSRNADNLLHSVFLHSIVFGLTGLGVGFLVSKKNSSKNSIIILFSLAFGILFILGALGINSVFIHGADEAYNFFGILVLSPFILLTFVIYGILLIFVFKKYEELPEFLFKKMLVRIVLFSFMVIITDVIIFIFLK
jgi:hypothetical protein